MNYLFYNPIANNFHGLEVALEKEAILKKKFDDLKLMSVNDVNPGAFAKTLKEDDNIILTGGDGTLNHFINALDTDLLVGNFWFVESGTGNDFVRGLDKDPETGLINLKPFLENLPYVRVKDKTYRFINGIGFGIDGECCKKADELKQKGAKKIDYGSITIKLLLFGYHRPTATVTIDDKETYKFKRTYLATAMHGKYYGGGMKIAPFQERNSGLLTFVCYFGASKLRTLINFPRLFKGTLHEKKSICKVFTGKKVHVKFDKPTALQIDGETVKDVLEYIAFVK